MSAIRRRGWLLGLVLPLLGCATMRTWHVQSNPCADEDMLSAQGMTVFAYTTADSVRHLFHGRVRLLEDGRLLFFTSTIHPRPTESPVEPSDELAFTLEREELLTLELEDPKKEANAFLLGLLIGGAIGAFGLV